MNFLKLVGNGKVIVVEPDECNCEALKRLSEGGNLSGRLVLSEKGAWSVPGTLQYLSNPNHPATNILKVVRESARGDKSACGYHEKEVPVDTLDNILASIGFVKPRLISITANGAEPEILKGLSQTLMLGVPFISLAATGPGYEQLMADLNYDMIAFDDRGYTFARRDTPMVSD
jgi:FkbM family methyltransferase